jgi:hypothetical protein
MYRISLIKGVFAVFHTMDTSVRQIALGNLLLVLCCAFYLAWWLLAFRPADPIRGVRTSWLLFPATAAGLTAIVCVVRALGAPTPKPWLIPGSWLLWGGVLLYGGLLALTAFLFHRPVTTELILIVGWAMLALAEISALYAFGALTHSTAILQAVITAAAAVISLVCYLLYYHLDAAAGYIDGIMPLVLVALVMAGIDLALLYC